MDSTISKLWIGIITSLMLLLLPISYSHAADFRTAGDWGQGNNAQANLKNLARDQSKSFFGIGDYLYSSSPSKTISDLWNAIPSKKGAPGNHECEKGQGTAWASSTFGYGSCKTKGYGAYIRGGNTGVIILNPYGDYKQGTGQYNFVLSKTNQYKNDSSILWIVYIVHDLFYPVGCSGSHCHGIEKSAFVKLYDPIIRSSGKALLIQAHTHLTATGTIKNLPVAICGGGGEDKTTATSDLKGYSWVTSRPGYCKIHTELGKATAQLIGTNNQVIHMHTWTK